MNRLRFCSFRRILRNSLLPTVAFVFSLERTAATPASGQFEKFAQPDGSFIELRNAGDEWFHWHETTNGFVVLQDHDGFWKFAQAQPGSPHLRSIPDAIVGR